MTLLGVKIGWLRTRVETIIFQIQCLNVYYCKYKMLLYTAPLWLRQKSARRSKLPTEPITAFFNFNSMQDYWPLPLPPTTTK